MENIIFKLTNKTDGDNTKDEKDLNPKSLISFIFAFIIVELYFISPTYFIFKYNKKYIEKKHIPFLQIFLNLLNCSTYVVIALTGNGDFQNLITNLIGVIICLLVILHLWLSLPNKKNSNYLFNFFFVFNIIFQIYYFIFKYKKSITDYITIIINISMYLSLNIGTYYAFKENKADRIPILSAVLGLLSSIGWTLYAAFLGEDQGKDFITLFSNIFSFLVLIFTIFCYIYLAIFKSHIKNNINILDSDTKNNEVEGQLKDEKNNELENQNEDEN